MDSGGSRLCEGAGLYVHAEEGRREERRKVHALIVIVIVIA